MKTLSMTYGWLGGIFLGIMLITFITLKTYSSADAINAGKIVTVEQRALTKSLFYSGIVQALNTTVIASPADGVVLETDFQYGDQVSAGQLLFTLSSSKFISEYKTALMQYIKAKNDFNNSESMLKEANFLHKNQLISDDDFKTKQSNFYGARLGLLQAKDSLDNLLQQLNIKNLNLHELTIENIERITQAMQLQMTTDKLLVRAPVTGIILSGTKNEDNTKKIVKGDVVEQGAMLAVIGNLQGLSVRIKVDELTVNQIHPGQKVKVTGIAFPEHTLLGVIKKVERQGESAGGGVPTFAAEIIVPQLTEAEQHVIHVGMSANVEINTETSAQIIVPLTAISEKEGISYIKRYDEKSKQPIDVAVKTGQTTLDSVAILSNLKSGDKIVIPN